mmetsp:Transcript_47225/g.146095  ORF Transcript_47225/g.146095 Transcript_47225/m.146095 type:complete len:280 (+) Transcript_47225:86-925(+)
MNSASETLPSRAPGLIFKNRSSRDSVFFWQYSLSASRSIFAMLATTKLLPPSTVKGAAASVVFSSSASKPWTISFTSCSSIFATNLCSCSLAAALALARSTCTLFRRLTNFVRVSGSSLAFLSLCLSSRNFRASSSLSCASCSASPNLSTISWAASCEVSSVVCAERGAAARMVFCTASSASVTLACACCSKAMRLRLSVSLMNCTSFSFASSFLLMSARISCEPAMDTWSTKPFTSSDLAATNARASPITFWTAAAAASESATALAASSMGRISMPLR